MELKEEILNIVKEIYKVNELDVFSNKGLNGVIYNSDGKLIKVSRCNESVFGPCDEEVIERKLEHQNNLKRKKLLVPEIYTNPYGNLSTIIRCDNKSYIVYAMEKIDTIDQSIEDFILNWGKALGKIHNNSVNIDLYHYQREWENIKKLCDDEKLRKIWESLLTEISLFEKTEKSYGLLHGDPQQNNFLPTLDGMYTIDFDNMFNGFFAHDIAIGLQFMYTNIRDYLKTELSIEEREKIFNEFMIGYYSVRRFDKSILLQVDTFLRYRRAMIFIALYKSLQEKPDNFEVVREKVLRNEKIL